MSDLVFHRTAYAEAVTKRLLHPGFFEETSRDGLFITGIRRIGKTTFLRNDLIEKLTEEKALVIYVDLWCDREKLSPTKAILSAIHKTFGELSSVGFGVKDLKVDLKIVSFSFEPTKIGESDGVTLAEAFSELVEKINTNVVLIIDEIQATLKTESGRNLMMALKAARDAVNLRPHNPDKTFLLIVGTGSHRSFVTAMAAKSSQPFYGADRLDFPRLGDDYIDWAVNKGPMELTQIPSQEALKKGFEILGHRPREFRKVLETIQSYDGSEIDPAFRIVCVNQARKDADEILGPIKYSDRMTKLLFSEIAAAGDRGCSKLFSATYLKQLAADTGRKKAVSASTVQGKLAVMQKNDWIYPVGYGCYAVSDPQAGAVWTECLDEYMEDYE